MEKIPAARTRLGSFDRRLVLESGQDRPQRAVRTICIPRYVAASIATRTNGGEAAAALLACVCKVTVCPDFIDLPTSSYRHHMAKKVERSDDGA